MTGPVFNEIHVSTALTRLAKLQRSITEKDKTSRALAELKARLLLMLEEGFLAPWPCANIFWAIVKLQDVVPELSDMLPLFPGPMRRAAGGMIWQALSNIVWACAATRQDGEWLQDITATVAGRFTKLQDGPGSQALSNILWASAKLQSRAPALLASLPALVRTAGVRARDDMTPLSLGNALWAVAVLRKEVPELRKLVPMLAAEVKSNIAGMDALNVAKIAFAIGTLKPKPSLAEPLLRALALKTHQLLSSTEAGELSTLCWGLSLYGWQDKELLKAIAGRVVTIAPNVPQDQAVRLCLISCAFARLNARSRPMMQSIAESMTSLLQESGRQPAKLPWILCSLAWSYRKLEMSDRFPEFRARLTGELARRRLSEGDVDRSQEGPWDWQAEGI